MQAAAGEASNPASRALDRVTSVRPQRTEEVLPEQTNEPRMKEPLEPVWSGWLECL